MKTIFIILFAFACYGQGYVDIDLLTDSTLIGDYATLKFWEPPTTVTIGNYEIEMDSIATMTTQELNDFITLINFVANGIYWNDEIIEKLCIRFLPERLRIKTEYLRSKK